MTRHTTLISYILLSVFSLPVFAEKYFTWVDEMGRVNHTVIPEEENPLIKPEKNDRPLVKPEQTDGASVAAEPVIKSDALPIAAEVPVSSEAPVSNQSPASIEVPDDLKAPVVERDVNSTTAGNQTTGNSPALEAVNSEQVKPEPVVVNKTVESAASYRPKIEINEADYIDGDLLLEQGNIRSDDDLPYYTWTDEQGRVRNTPYRPSVTSGSAKNTDPKNKKEKKPVIYSVYEEYRRSEQLTGIQNTQPQKIDSFAQKLFFEGQAERFIDSFSKGCCEDLPKDSPSTLSFEDSVYVELDKNDDPYLFAEGKSPYKLIELPRSNENYSLKMKTFVKSSSKTGVKNGVFFPQIVFLDDEFQVMRIVRNPVLEYVPENWRRHGYLKGLFKVDGRENERYMLINTTKETLRARNRIENERVILLNNQKVGSIEVEALKN